MSGIQVNSAAAGAASWQSRNGAQEKEDPSFTIYERMKEAREQAQAARDRFDSAQPKPRYGDAPMEAYSRLARAKRPAEVSAAAGYARRQIARLKAAKRTDPGGPPPAPGAAAQAGPAAHPGVRLSPGGGGGQPDAGPDRRRGHGAAGAGPEDGSPALRGIGGPAVRRGKRRGDSRRRRGN